MTENIGSEQALTNLESIINQGIAEIGLSLSASQETSLLRYILLLNKWNRTYNLTSIRDMGQMVIQHLLDSLAVIPYLPLADAGVRVLDVGSGAGLPAIPLAIACPGVNVTMLDSNQKKTAFMLHVVGDLRLANATVINARVESWYSKSLFRIIISRAYAQLSQFAEQTRHLLDDGGTLAAMKGQIPLEEINTLPNDFVVTEIVKLKVPRLDAERHLVLVSPK